MRIIVFAGTAVLVALIASCDAYKWPPYENQLRSMFAESKSVLTEIETEMIADGLHHIGPKPRRIRHGEPELSETKVRKYDELFERLPYRWKLSRYDGVTSIGVNGTSPRGLGKDFYYSLIHGDIAENLPSCDSGGRTVSCGMCNVDLEDNWHLQYQWLPKDIGPDWDGRVDEGLPAMEEIEEQYQREVEKCFEAGLMEMGVDPDAK